MATKPVREAALVTWAEEGTRWWGVRIWREWSVSGALSHMEECVLLLRAETEADASAAAWTAACRSDSDFLNSDGETVTIRTTSVDHVYDMKLSRLRSGAEVFSLLFEVAPDGGIDAGPAEENEA
jgi:hypothetical protein